MTTEKDVCCFGPDKSEQCKIGEKCSCLERVPFHLRTDKVIYSKPKAPKPLIPYGSEVRYCSVGDCPEEANPIPRKECCDFLGIHPEPEISPSESDHNHSQIRRSPSDRMQAYWRNESGNTKKTLEGSGRLLTSVDREGDCRAEQARTRETSERPLDVGIRLTTEGAGDWTRFDLMSDVPDSDEDNSSLRAVSTRGRQDAVADGEESDEDVEDNCKCDDPFCRACKQMEDSSESSEAAIIEKTVSFDEEIIEAVDSEMWLNPVPRRKVLQFANIEQREKYKAELLEKMRNTAANLPRSEWENRLTDFDHYVTILMGESSPESSSDCDDTEIRAEKGRIRKQRKKKRLMYGVEDVKNVPLHCTRYVRCYMEFMEDLKKRAAVAPNHYWPRFMKSYGAAADEEKEPEWLGLLLMAPKECFREISSSSSCESLPVMSDPGSTTTSMTSTGCSPSACAVDSAELLKKAGVCVLEKDNDFPTEEAAEEEETLNDQDDSPIARPSSKSRTLSYDLKPGSQEVIRTGRTPSFPSARSRSSQFWGALGAAPSKSRQSRFSSTFFQPPDHLESQASDMMRSFSRKRSTKLLNIQEKLGLADEIVVLQQELLPTSLGVRLREFGEGHLGETDRPHPEFDMMRRNVIFIVRGKLYKMSYECLCGETCYCDPKMLVEKYIGLLISEIYGLEDTEEEEEEDEAKETDVAEASGPNDDLAAQSAATKGKGVEPDGTGAGQNISPEKPERTRVEEPRFLLDPDVNVDLKDRAIRPRGLYDNEDIERVKATSPDGIVAYKDFYQHGDLKGITLRSKEAKKQEIENKNLAEPSSSVLDANSEDETSGSDVEDNRSHSITESQDSYESGSSSQPLCQCCTCVKKYEESGRIIRRCDKKSCSCCACKAKIVKIAKKLYTRRKGSRFLYILLKKIRRAINKPTEETREQSLQGCYSVRPSVYGEVVTV